MKLNVKKNVWNQMNKRKIPRRPTKIYRQIRPLPLGFPLKHTATLKYVDNITIDNSGIGGVGHYFSANGLYDPNITGTGHQPKYFDQLMSIYDHYCVLGSKISVKYMPTGTSNNIPGMFALTLTDDTGQTYTDSSDFLENSTSGTSRVYNLLETVGAGKNPIITSKFSLYKYFNLIKSKKSIDNEFRGNNASNPAEQAYFQLMTFPISGTDPTNAAFQVSISYTVVFTELKRITQS